VSILAKDIHQGEVSHTRGTQVFVQFSVCGLEALWRAGEQEGRGPQQGLTSREGPTANWILFFQ
jgi:hypothetical protein